MIIICCSITSKTLKYHNYDFICICTMNASHEGISGPWDFIILLLLSKCVHAVSLQHIRNNCQ